MKKAKIFLILVAAILLLGAFALNAAGAEELTDVYLSESGDDTNPGTSGAPVQSLNKALELVADGGTVHIVDSYTAPSGFVWDNHNKDVTITGGELDLSQCYTASTQDEGVNYFCQGDAVTYDGLELILADDGYYFANGFRLQVNENVTITCDGLWLFGGGYRSAVAGTDVKLLGGDYNRIYGGSYKSGVSGDVNLYVGKVNPNYTSSHDGTTRLYGACSSGNVTGDVNLTIAGANLDYVSGVSHTNTCGVTGKVNVLMTGGKLYSLYAGGTNAKPGGGIYLTMTGGEVAQVFGTGSSSYTGNILIDLQGGTITRRLFGGCYNEYSILTGYGSSYHVTGNIDVLIHEGMVFKWDTSEDDNGLYAHSRYNPLFDDEITTLYYMGENAKTEHEDNLGNQGGFMGTVMGSSTTVADTISTITTEVEKWNVVLGDDLGANFYVKVPETVAKVSQLKVTFDGETKTYDLSKQKPYETGLYLIPVDVAAAQMTEPITLQLVVNGTECESVSYTIRDYALVILSGSYSDQIQTLVKHMLDYGTAAQNYFGINTTDPANADYVLDYTAQWPAEYPAVTTDGQISGVNFYGASLILDNRTAIRYYFEASSVEGVTFTANGKKYTPVQKGSMYYVEVPGILPHEYSESTVLTAVKGTEKLTVSYSPLTYMVRMSQKGSDTLKALVNAMYGYHEAAAAYMNNVTILTGPIQLEQVLTGVISVQPGEYTVGTQIAENAGSLSAEAFAASMKLIKVVSEDDLTWFVDAEGKLALAVASIDDTLYISLEAALEAANATAEADTITLLGNVTVSEQLQVTEDVTIIADKPVTVTGTASVFNVASGKSLTVAGTESTKISLVCSDTTANVIYNEGSLSLEHVNISGGYNAIYAEENTTTTLSQVAITDVNYRGIHGNGALVVQDVTIDSTTNHGIYLGANASITGSGLTMKNTGSNGIFSEGANITISGLTIENTSQQGVQVKGGTIQFSDFTMKGTGSAAVRVREDAQMTLNDGTIYADTYGIAVSETSNTIVTDVTVERTGKKTDALVNIAGSAALELSGTTKIDGKGFKGHGVNVAASTATFTVNGGTVTGNTADSYADVVLASGTTITLQSALTEQVTVKPGAYTAGTVVAEKADALSTEDFASAMEQIQIVPTDSQPWIVDGEGKLAEAVISIDNMGYTTLEAAVAAANAMEEAATITVSADVTVEQLSIQNDVTIVNGKTDGVLTITGSATVFEVAKGKSLTITGTESAKIAIVGYSGTDVIVSTGTVKLSYVDISGGQKGINIQNNGHLEASNIQVSGTSGQALYFTGANATGSVSNFVISESGSAAVRPMKGAQVTLTDGTIYADTYGIAVDGSSGAVLTNVTIERTGKKTDALVNIADSATLELSGTTKIDGKGYAGHGVNVAASTATFIVNGGTITNTADGYADVVLVSDATIQLKQTLTATVSVKPKTFTAGITIAANVGELSAEDFAASMKLITVVSSDGNTWFVDAEGKLAKAEAALNGEYYTSFASAVTAANATAEADTITLLSDVTLEALLEITEDVTIENGTAETLTITGPSDNTFKVAAEKTLTITGTESSKITLAAAVTNKDVIIGYGTVNLTYVDISGGLKAINIQDGGHLEASHIQVSGTSGQALYFTGSEATGSVSNFVISETGSAAVRPMNGAQVTLTDGTIYADTYGVAVSETSGAVLTNVIIERTGKKTDALVNVAGSATLELSGTTKINGKGYAGHGVNVAASSATFTMNGGTITNTADGYADVVLVKGKKLTLGKVLTEQITVNLGTYTAGTVVVDKTDALSAEDFAASIQYINLGTDEWHIDSTGALAETGAILGGVHYTTLEAAITAAEAGATVKVVRDATLTQTVTKAITVTADKAVTVTASDDVTSHMFSITSGTLTITGASEDAKITLQAGTATLAVIHTNGGNAALTNVDLVGNGSSTAASNGGRGIFNEAGTVTAKSVNIQNMVKGDGVYIKKGATLNLDNVKIIDAGRYGIKTYGTVNIYNTVHTDHALTIQNSNDHAIDIDAAGSVNSYLNNVLENTYAIQIDTTRKSSARGIIVRGNGSLQLTNISIQNTMMQGVLFNGTSTKPATGTISDFAISGTGAAVELVYSTVTLTNGTLNIKVADDGNSTLTENNVTVVE